MARGTCYRSGPVQGLRALHHDLSPRSPAHEREGFNAHGYRPVALLDPTGKCTGCALSALICPDVVLTVYRYDPKRATGS